MTPQLQQAIRLLQLPVLDLNAQIQDALEENIMLEMEDLPDVPQTSAEKRPPRSRRSRPKTSGKHEPSERIQDGGWNGEGRPISEFADESGQTLREHLLWQLEMEHFSPREVIIGEAIVDAINDDGYLTIGLDEIAESSMPDSDIRSDEIDATLAKVQKLDPGGRRRTLAIRVHRAAAPTARSRHARSRSGHRPGQRASRPHCDARVRRDPPQPANVRGTIARCARTGRGCNPRPGQSVSPAAAEYVIPDVFVRKIDNRWQVEISPTGIPRLSVNQQYAQLLRGSGDHAVLRTQLQEARWLIRSLEIRNETLLKVATCIVSRQTEFLEHGDEAMKPMVLRDVAEEIGMHESTISRVTTNKYMHTPRGVFEFKYFFSSHLSTADGRGPVVDVGTRKDSQTDRRRESGQTAK